MLLRSTFPPPINITFSFLTSKPLSKQYKTHYFGLTFPISVLPKITERPQTQVVYEKDNFTLHCAASGKPTPVITWFKDGQRVGNGPHYNETATKSGTYVHKCEANNGIGGPASASATVTVKTPCKRIALPFHCFRICQSMSRCLDTYI